MAWCCENGSAWGLWWLVPLIGIALCITMCMLFRHRMANRPFYCWGGRHTGDLDGMKKDIQELKDELDKIKQK
jgi:hypothetical protein